MLTYVDTSAWGKFLLPEQESTALKEFVDARAEDGHGFVSSALLEVELSRIAHRESRPLAEVRRLVQDVVLLNIGVSVLATARRTTVALKTLDAIHLATALQLAHEAEGDDEWIDVFVTYDAKMAAAARDAGFEVASPGVAVA